MQAITAEFNYSESTFVLPSDNPAAAARVRIFTPTHEIPFAGHPNVGTAVALALAGSVLGRDIGDRIRFEEEVGLVTIEILRHAGAPTGAKFTAPGETKFGSMFEAAAIAETVGLMPDDIRVDRHLPRLATLGVGFVFAEVNGIEVLNRCQPAPDRFKTHLPSELTEGLYLYTLDGDRPDLHVNARLFTPQKGIVEDPATGSAAAMIGALTRRLDPHGADFTLMIDQGIQMGRPSRILVDVKRDAAGDVVKVGGNAVPVMQGTITF